MPEARTKPKRRTQEERRTATRAALLDATIDCLIEYGYTGVTTTRVVERAGVSRGAQVHHFPTKAELVAESVRHLAVRRAGEMLPKIAKLPEGKQRMERALDLIWESHTGPLFQAALELWVAARTDPELRAQLGAVERDVTAAIWEGAEGVFGEIASKPGFEQDLEMALATMRGLALLAAATGERRKSLDARWIATRARLLAMFEAPLPKQRKRAA